MKRVIILITLFFVVPLTVHATDNNITEMKNIYLEKEEILHYRLEFFDDSFIDYIRLEELMNQLENQVYKDPENATFDEGGGIIEEKNGITLDRDLFFLKFHDAFYQVETQRFEVPIKEVLPRVDSEMLKNMSEKELGSYTTYYKEENEKRTNNIVLSTNAINGSVVFPGETFSFNEVVGERTKERGYEKAPVIVKGEYAEDIGGGICQVSSTLFNAVELPGIEVVERYTHSRNVPYVPPGQDATVSWWGPDFVFKNLFNEPIVIQASAKNGNLMIRVLSSDSMEPFKGRE